MSRIRTIAAAGICLAMLWTASPAVPAAAEADKYRNIDRIDEVMQLIRHYSISGITDEELTQAAIRGMVDALDDPYSNYFPKEEKDYIINSFAGEQYTIGIGLKLGDAGIVIETVKESSPASLAGLLPGDILKKINGTEVTLDNINDLLNAARGKKDGDTIRLTVLRNDETLSMTVLYKKVELPLVESGVFTGGIGYVKLVQFNERSEKDFGKALDSLQKQNIRSLIFDLRDNGGGELSAAQVIASRFIKEGVFTIIRDSSGEEEVVKITRGKSVGVPVFVLVNGHTASASEMLTGALQDNGVATVVGQETYGKGVGQNYFDLITEEGMLSVTSMEYYTPQHHEVNEVGIEPDVVTEGSTQSMFKALRLAGGAPLQLSIGKTSYQLNGMDFPGEIAVLHEEGKTYVPSRLLAALTDSIVRWVGEESSVSFIQKGVETYFSAASGMKMADDMSYIDLDAFHSKFPSFSWKAEGAGIVLTAGE